MELVRTYVEGLDETLGGLPAQSVVMVTGEPGSGHDLLAQQILYLHALKGGKGSKSVYFSTFKSDDVVRENLANYGWKLENLENNKQWEFVDLRSKNCRQALSRKISSKIRKGSWTLIDSFSHLLMRQQTKQAFSVIERLLETSRKFGGVHFLIFTKRMHDPQMETTMQEFVDGVLEIVMQEVGGGISRRIKIKKLKAVHVTRLIPFALTLQGITVETAVRI
jgi:KaiC/GvpD/RAD55 family RecA-like ATPase